MIGLNDKEISMLKDSLKVNPKIEYALVFGSRAMGNCKKGSDVDIALFGSDLSIKDISRILEDMDNKLFPYFLDIVIYDKISNLKLKAHIDEFGEELYRKSANNS